MRHTSIALLILVAGLLSWTPILATPQRDQSSLARLKKIYIDSTSDAQPDPQREPLARELTKVGFDIVTSPSQPDAILTVSAQVQLVLDGDGSVPNKSFFTYQLAPPDKTLLWKYKVNSVMRTIADDINFGATKMATKLLKDKQTAMVRSICPTP